MKCIDCGIEKDGPQEWSRCDECRAKPDSEWRFVTQSLDAAIPPVIWRMPTTQDIVGECAWLRFECNASLVSTRRCRVRVWGKGDELLCDFDALILERDKEALGTAARDQSIELACCVMWANIRALRIRGEAPE